VSEEGADGGKSQPTKKPRVMQATSKKGLSNMTGEEGKGGRMVEKAQQAGGED